MLRGLLWKEAFGLHIEEENQDLKCYSIENSEEPQIAFLVLCFQVLGKPSANAEFGIQGD